MKRPGGPGRIGPGRFLLHIRAADRWSVPRLPAFGEARGRFGAAVGVANKRAPKGAVSMMVDADMIPHSEYEHPLILLIMLCSMVNEGGFPALGAHFTLQPSSTPQEPANRPPGRTEFDNLAFVRRFRRPCHRHRRPAPPCPSAAVASSNATKSAAPQASGSQPEPLAGVLPGRHLALLGSSQKNGQQSTVSKPACPCCSHIATTIEPLKPSRK